MEPKEGRPIMCIGQYRTRVKDGDSIIGAPPSAWFYRLEQRVRIRQSSFSAFYIDNDKSLLSYLFTTISGFTTFANCFAIGTCTCI